MWCCYLGMMGLHGVSFMLLVVALTRVSLGNWEESNVTYRRLPEGCIFWFLEVVWCIATSIDVSLS